MVRRWCIVCGVVLALPGAAWAAGGGSDAPLVIVADTRHLTGIMGWLGSLYNESRVGFTLLTVAAVPITGLILGISADLVLGAIGLDLRHRGSADH